jgi:hypothetical protein
MILYPRGAGYYLPQYWVMAMSTEIIRLPTLDMMLVWAEAGCRWTRPSSGAAKAAPHPLADESKWSPMKPAITYR